MNIKSLLFPLLAVGTINSAVAQNSELAISETRPIEDMHRRTIGFIDAGVWISNEFEGARASDAWQVGEDEFVVLNRPENAPINPSPWYAFKVWAETPRTISVRLTYENGMHRYWPEYRHAGEPWVTMDSSTVEIDSVAREATLRLDVGPDTVWVAGQEMLTSSFFDSWTAGLAEFQHDLSRQRRRSASSVQRDGGRSGRGSRQ